MRCYTRFPHYVYHPPQHQEPSVLSSFFWKLVQKTSPVFLVKLAYFPRRKCNIKHIKMTKKSIRLHSADTLQCLNSLMSGYRWHEVARSYADNIYSSELAFCPHYTSTHIPCLHKCCRAHFLSSVTDMQFIWCQKLIFFSGLLVHKSIAAIVAAMKLSLFYLFNSVACFTQY